MFLFIVQKEQIPSLSKQEQLMIRNRHICCRQWHGAERFSKMHLLDSVLFYLHLCEYEVQLLGESASDAINCASVSKDEHQMAHTFRQKNSFINNPNYKGTVSSRNKKFVGFP